MFVLAQILYEKFFAQYLFNNAPVFLRLLFLTKITFCQKHLKKQISGWKLMKMQILQKKVSTVLSFTTGSSFGGGVLLEGVF